MILDAVKRPDPAPQRSESEVITLALSQEPMEELREDHVFRRHQASLRPFFPGLTERSRSLRRKRDRWSVIPAVRVSVQIVWEALEREGTAAMDSAPVPCVSNTPATQASNGPAPPTTVCATLTP